jgi:CRISPR-associated protein Cas5d
MKPYSIALEISGPTAMWTRADSGDAPTSYEAPTFQAAKQIFESILWLWSAEVIPWQCEICSPVIKHRYLRGSPFFRPLEAIVNLLFVRSVLTPF